MYYNSIVACSGFSTCSAATVLHETALCFCFYCDLCLQINDVDDFGLRVYNTVKRHRILPVDIALNSGSLLVTVGKDAQQPPYRIENR